MILLSLIMAFSIKSVSAQDTTITLINPLSGNSTFAFPEDTPINSTFIANVTVADADFLSAWQINITWDPTLLKINSTDDLIIPSDNIFGAYPDPTEPEMTNSSVFWMVGITFGGPDYVNVTSGIVCQLQFTILQNGTGSCNIHFVIQGENLFYTKLIDYDGELIDYTAEDGAYSIPEFNMNILVAIFLLMTLCAFAFGRKTLIGKRLRHTTTV